MSSFNSKEYCYSYAWSWSLCEGGTSFCTGSFSRKFREFLFLFSTGFNLFGVLLLLPLSITIFVFVHCFWSISSNTDEVLSINPYANLFAFGDFNVHHKDWLTYSGKTKRPGELCFNISFSNDPTQMVIFPTWVPDCDSHGPAILDLFLLTLVFVLQWLSLSREILIMLLSHTLLTLLQTQKEMPPFIAHLMTILVLIGSLCNHLDMFHRGCIFKLGTSAKCCELV